VLEGVVRLKVSARLRRCRVRLVSVATTFQNSSSSGVIFMPISERSANTRTGEEVSRHGVADSDNYFATLNSAVFSDGSFVYVPPGVRCRWNCRPISASTNATPDSSSAR